MKQSLTQTILLIMAGILLFPVLAFGGIDIRYTDDGLKIINNDQWIKIGGTLMWDIVLLIVFIVIIGVLLYLLILLLRALKALVSSIFSSRKINKVVAGRGTVSGEKIQ